MDETDYKIALFLGLGLAAGAMIYVGNLNQKGVKTHLHHKLCGAIAAKAITKDYLDGMVHMKWQPSTNVFANGDYYPETSYKWVYAQMAGPTACCAAESKVQKKTLHPVVAYDTRTKPRQTADYIACADLDTLTLYPGNIDWGANCCVTPYTPT